MVLQEEKERVKTLLSDTITLLCRNGLTFKSEFNISALIGITLDKENVFLVDIRETIKNTVAPSDDGDSDASSTASREHSKRKRRRRKRSVPSVDSADSIQGSEDENGEPREKRTSGSADIKQESVNIDDEDSEELVFVKNEPATTPSGQYPGGPNQDNFAGSMAVSQANSSQASAFGGPLSELPSAIAPSWESFSQSLPPGSQPPVSVPHMLIPGADPSQKRFECDMCGNAYQNASSLGRHVKQIHFGQFPYHCKACNKPCPDFRGLEKHQKACSRVKIHQAVPIKQVGRPEVLIQGTGNKEKSITPRSPVLPSLQSSNQAHNVMTMHQTNSSLPVAPSTKAVEIRHTTPQNASTNVQIAPPSPVFSRHTTLRKDSTNRHVQIAPGSPLFSRHATPPNRHVQIQPTDSMFSIHSPPVLPENLSRFMVQQQRSTPQKAAPLLQPAMTRPAFSPRGSVTNEKNVTPQSPVSLTHQSPSKAQQRAGVLLQHQVSTSQTTPKKSQSIPSAGGSPSVPAKITPESPVLIIKPDPE